MKELREKIVCERVVCERVACDHVACESREAEEADARRGTEPKTRTSHKDVGRHVTGYGQSTDTQLASQCFFFPPVFLGPWGLNPHAVAGLVRRGSVRLL